VLRHGDNNTVEGNNFFGNNKPGTGGVRIINKGQWVVNNYFYKCLGTGFRAPIAIMNGVPNSPAIRYVAVSEAVICTNTFIDCSPLSFCEGSDNERSITPYNTLFANNYFKNSTTANIFTASDNISGITFYKNFVTIRQSVLLAKGFERLHNIKCPKNAFTFSDSLQKISKLRLQSATLESNIKNISKPIDKPVPNWVVESKAFEKKSLTFNCKNTTDIETALNQKYSQPITIQLTGTVYKISTPLLIHDQVIISSKQKLAIQFSVADSSIKSLFYLSAGSMLTLDKIQFNLSTLSTPYCIISDSSGASNHYNLLLQNISVQNYQGIFFNASKTSVANSIVVNQCTFSKNNGTLFNLQSETDNKGYYNVEYLAIKNSSITKHTGQLITLVRSGKDESTLGPLFELQNNRIKNCISHNQFPFIKLNGVQQSKITNNNFLQAAYNQSLIEYIDVVRARHIFTNNTITNCGNIFKNNFVVEQKNKIK
jgi:poly(beta-D-mannuronate) lyase